MAAKTKILKLGSIFAPGREVPIIGPEGGQIVLNKESSWNMMDLGINNSGMAVWKGDKLPCFRFNFTLYIDGDHVQSSDDLVDMMKAMHAAASHQEKGGKAVPPPACRLYIAPYIAVNGTVSRITTRASGPWIGGNASPSSVTFEGDFLIIPNYSGTEVEIATAVKKLSSAAVSYSFYNS